MLKHFFAEYADGRVYTSQIGDHRIFYSDTSVRLINKVSEPENKGIFVNLYPNPTNNLLHISLQQNIVLMHIMIHNSIGATFPAVVSNGSVDVSSLPNGIYFITVTTNKGSSTLCFIRNN